MSKITFGIIIFCIAILFFSLGYYMKGIQKLSTIKMENGEDAVQKADVKMQNDNSQIEISEEDSSNSLSDIAEEDMAAAAVSKNDLLEDEEKTVAKNDHVVAKASGITYQNDKYGFQIVLPNNWDKYKSKSSEGKVEITLPSKNGEYQLEGDNGSYTPIVDILFWNKDDWKKYLKDCADNPSPNCFDEGAITAKNDQYVFIVTTSPEALPDISLNGSGDYIRRIKDSFITRD